MNNENQTETKQVLNTDEKFNTFKSVLRRKGVNFTVVAMNGFDRFFADGKVIADVRHKRKFSLKSKFSNDNKIIGVDFKDDVEKAVDDIIKNSKINVTNVPVVDDNTSVIISDNLLVPEDFVYIPRNVETGNTDLEEFEDAMKQCKNVLLQGPTGSGKTSLVRKYCAKHQRPYRRLSLNGGITVEDLVGHYVLKNDESPWIDGILTRAVREGWVLAVDEINAASPEVLFVLNSLLDDERILILSAKDGEVIKPHSDFRLIATMNPSEQGYAGTNEMNEALLDRFHTIMEIDYNTKVEQKILKQMGLDSEKVSAIMDFTNKIREAYAKSEIFTPWSTRSIINFAESLLQGKEKLIVNRFKLSDRDTIRDLMDTFIYQTKPVEESNEEMEW
jgi:gas vesicle protein GvpN